MEQAFTLRDEYRSTLSEEAYSLLAALAEKAEVVKNTLCTVVHKVSFASELGKTRKTLDKYLKELEDNELLEQGTKRGRNGGSVIVLSAEAVNFPKGSTILNSTAKMDELKDYFFPKPDKKEPKRKYRSKEEILRERMIRGKAMEEEERLNEILRNSDFPTREFFKETKNPLVYTRAYLLSRMYNAFVVIYPNERKDYYESQGDERGHTRSSRQTEYYKHYDCLDKEFIGTPTFKHFLKLALLLDEARMDPVDYLTSQFNFMNYLELSGNAKVGLPFINTLWGKEAYERHIKDHTFWAEHYVKHPYYKPSEILKSPVWKYPIVSALSDLYDNPDKYEHMDVYQDVIDTIEKMGYTPNKIRTVIAYCKGVLENIEKSDISEDQKEILTAYMKQQYAVHLGQNRLSSAAYVATFPYQIMGKIMDRNIVGIDDYREYYQELGNIGNLKEYNANDIQMYTKRGYFYDFSFTANTSFPTAFLTVGSLRQNHLDPKEVQEALEAFGEEKIPLTNNGMLDVDALYAEYLTEEQLLEDKRGYELFHKDDFVFDSNTELWYDLVNTKKESDDYRRNGRCVVK